MMHRVKWKDLVLGFAIATVLLLPWTNLLETKPYKSVEVVSVKTVGRIITIVANFEKTACTFERLEVFGTTFGQNRMLPWDNKVPNVKDNGQEYDRSAGDQTLSIRVHTSGKTFDKIEIRTRHTCGGTVVDKIFATVKPQY